MFVKIFQMFLKVIKFLFNFFTLTKFHELQKEEKTPTHPKPKRVKHIYKLPSKEAESSIKEETIEFISNHSYDNVSISNRSSLRYIVVHCSDSTWGNAEEINKWHIERNFKKIGYHFVILNGKETSNSFDENKDGIIEIGRKESETGAHALGYNSNSIGICMIGKDKFTYKQFESLRKLIKYLQNKYSIPTENVIGHYETPKANGKTCPNFDMVEFRKTLS